MDAVIKSEKPARPAKAEKPPKTEAELAEDARLAAQKEVCRQTWAAYCEAYVARYSIEPARNGTTNSQVINLVKRLGKEAPDVARFFVSCVNESFVVSKCHDLGLLVPGYQSYRTQWMTGNTITQTRARQIDQSQANFSVVGEAMAIRRAKQEARNAQ